VLIFLKIKMVDKEKIKYLERKACEIRNLTLKMCSDAGTGHVTSSMSSAELLTSLYNGNILRHDPANPNWDNRDRFILSKGQASPILYATLAANGYFPREWLDSFNKKGGHFGVHLQCDIPGVEYTTGSLGHGLGLGVGVALAAKMDEKDYHTYVLLGDAELQEGSNWESAMLASSLKLNNLTGIVDRNGYGVLCPTEDAAGLEPLEDRFGSFGWETKRINGHSIPEIYSALDNLRAHKRTKPLMVIADTVKGKGVDSWENVALKHGIAPTDSDEQYKTALELSANSPSKCFRCPVHDLEKIGDWGGCSK
jgi:transketolase